MPPARFYGCASLQSVTVDARGQLLPCIMDRSRRFGDIADLNADAYAETIAKEREYFLGRNRHCQGCEYNAKKVCGGFCRFSNTYQKYSS
jgi:radical SAM protein with 4Fe4S-binding SPASM domain